MRQNPDGTDHNWYQNWKSITEEQRRWYRHPAVGGTIAMLSGRPYNILDISRGGLAIYNHGGEAVPEEMVLSLLAPDEGLVLDALRCRKVAEAQTVLLDGSRADVIHRISLEIMNLDPDIEDQLNAFIRIT